MIRFLGIVSLAALLALAPLSAEETQLEASPALFSVMAALNAAGYDADLNSPSNHPLRAEIRKELASRKLPVVAELRSFLREHRQPNPGADLSQYISFALVTDGPPAFNSKLRHNETPPDVLELDGFARLMVRFHEEAGIDELWRKAQPAYEEALARYHEPVTQRLLEVNGYFRNIGSGYLGRQFRVHVELLGPPNQVHTRSYKDDYYVVLTPSAEPKTDDIRHAYLHYILDPLFAKYSEEAMKKRGLIDYAQQAPALGEQYKSDFLLLAVESMAKAVEARLGASGRRTALLQQTLAEGYVLAPHFAEQLAAYEKQEQSMRFYFPEMVKSIDLKKEERRLDKVEFAAAPAARPAVSPANTARQAPPPPESPAEQKLEEAEQLYTERQLERARQSFLEVLQLTDQSGAHAKAYYGLARVATLQNNGELAERLFRKVLEFNPEGPVRAWSLVYLARLSEVVGDHEEAKKNYQAALAVNGISDAARAAATKGLQLAPKNP